MGEMFASQVHHALVKVVLRASQGSGPAPVRSADMEYVGQKAAGEFMRERVFAPA